MAGGEGSRLRPLTSNQPKPMMPLANLPMMEHIIGLLQRHGFDEIVVTLAFMPNAIRTYFGDGSEFGVRMVYATEEQPLGTAGSVRNAMDELDERFLVISGDVLTDIDLSKIVVVPRRAQGARHDRARRRREPARVRHRHHPTRTARSSGSSRSRRGARSSATRSTPGIFVLEPEIFDYIPAGRAGRLLERGVPEAARRQHAAVRRGRRGLLGGRRHARGLRRAPTRTCSTARSTIDIPGFRLEHGVWLGEGAEIHPDAHGRRARGDRRELPRRGRRPARRVHGARQQRPRPRGRRPRARRRPRQRLPRAERAPARHGRRPGLRPAQQRALRGRRRARRRVLRRRERRARRGREGVPVQDGRDRRRSSTRRSCGSRAAPAACSGATASPASPTSTSRPSWPRKLAMAYATHAEEGVDGHHVARLDAGRRAC